MAALESEPPIRSPLEDEHNASAAVEPDGKRARSPTPERQSKRRRTSQSKSPPPDTAIETSAKGSDAPRESSVNKESRETNLTKSTSPPPQPPASPPQEQPTGPAKRGRKRVDEGQRAKRLFGALLNLDQKPDERTTRQRREIELRKKAELQQQDDRRASFEQRDQDRPRQKRRRTLNRVNCDPVSIRHDNMIHKAHFLQTRTEPHLYYLPWTIRPEEEDRIDDQIADARALIDREKSQSKDDRKRRRSTRDETPQVDRDCNDGASHDSEVQPPNGQSGDGTGDPAKVQGDGDNEVSESIPNEKLPAQDITTTKTTTTAATSSDNEEVEMEDGDEDTVLY